MQNVKSLHAVNSTPEGCEEPAVAKALDALATANEVARRVSSLRSSLLGDGFGEKDASPPLPGGVLPALAASSRDTVNALDGAHSDLRALEDAFGL